MVVRLEGANPEEVRRAGKAAMALFAEAGVTPFMAARDGWGISGFDPAYEGYDADPTNLWQRAAEVAAEAGCADWPPERARPTRRRAGDRALDVRPLHPIP